MGVLAKLRHFVPQQILLKTLYQVWTCCLGPSIKDTSQQNAIATKKALRRINFSADAIMQYFSSFTPRFYRRAFFTLSDCT